MAFLQRITAILYGSKAQQQNRLSKSQGQPGDLPVVDTSVPDNRRKQLQAKQDRETEGTGATTRPQKADVGSRRQAPAVLSRVYVDRPIRNGCGFTVIQFSDGTLTVKPEKTRPKGLDQSASPAAREELLQLALEHLKSKQTATKAATSATTKGAEQMKKSKKYDGLYLLKRTPKAAAKPVVRPTTSAPLTKSAPRQAEPLQAEHPPTPWGTMPTLADIAARNEQARTVATLPAAAPVYSMDENSRVIRSGSTLTGYEMAAMKNGVDLDKIPVGVDLTRMDQSAMKRLAHQQLRDSVNETRSKQGLPKLPNETEKRGFTASWV